jgi:hypothetical protein
VSALWVWIIIFFNNKYLDRETTMTLYDDLSEFKLSKKAKEKLKNKALIKKELM